MKMLMQAKIPNEPFNDAVRDGSAGKRLKLILEETKPETVYFTEFEGQRCAMMIVNINDPSEIPGYSEPWFLAFDAEVEFHVAMTPEDLERSGIEELGKKW